MFVLVKDLVFRHAQTQETIFRGLDFSVERGEVVAIIGPSGCGKSTLLKLISGLLHPSRGSLLVDGSPPCEYSKRRLTGHMFQTPLLLPWLSVIDNVLLPLNLQSSNGHKAEEARADAQHLLAGLGLPRNEASRPFELSGGMMQRVAIARALVSKPLFLLLDEPFGSLDPVLRLKLAADLSDAVRHSGSTTILVSHHLEESLLVADRIVVLGKKPTTIVDDIDNSGTLHGNMRSLSDSRVASLTNRMRHALVANDK